MYWTITCKLFTNLNENVSLSSITKSNSFWIQKKKLGFNHQTKMLSLSVSQIFLFSQIYIQTLLSYSGGPFIIRAFPILINSISDTNWDLSDVPQSKVFALSIMLRKLLTKFEFLSNSFLKSLQWLNIFIWNSFSNSFGTILQKRQIW